MAEGHRFGWLPAFFFDSRQRQGQVRPDAGRAVLRTVLDRFAV